MNGAEWIVWWDHGVRHVITVPWWVLGAMVCVAAAFSAWRKL